MRPARSIPQQWRLAAWRWHRGALSGLQGGGPGRPETPRRNLHGATVTGAAGGGGGGGRWRWNPGASQASWTWMAPMVGVAGLVGKVLTSYKQMQMTKLTDAVLGWSAANIWC